ncbi:TetR/AcrR family transcriptional regulator [Nocardioides houyundeii]|uniref:TetR/AcrR family transcriptional regulator n=1 Tax=Nocardioides houyundeii TaxID=2045452 RepID=UPI000DF1FC7E|nr:TetR/AcrR family transcriptional regulator [Nocardioides houyundeii]
MPKIVDHDERRRQVVAAAWRIIAAEGVDAVTMRRLADELGLSNGALARYFPAKADIVGAVFSAATDATHERFLAAGGDVLTGSKALRALLHEMFPFDDVTRREALIVIPFFDYAQHNERLQRIWQDFVELERPLLDRIFDEMVLEGTARPDLDRTTALDFLFTVVSGAQANPLLLPETGTEERLQALVESALRALA